MKDNKPLVFIKIGGSLITDKTKPFVLKERALEVICDEIKLAMRYGKQLIIGNGNGSYGHIPAKKYQTNKGIINEQSLRGIAEVADQVRQLNQIVVKKLLEKSVNAVSVSPLSMMIAENHRLKSLFTESLVELLRRGLLPVVSGDQILDIKTGCTIFSTERVLGYLAFDFKGRGYHIERIIHCGLTNGVYDENGKTIECINSKNFELYRQTIGGSGGTDVSGGMIHKVEEALASAKQGIPGLIIDGVEHGSLSKAVAGERVLGTRIEA